MNFAFIHCIKNQIFRVVEVADSHVCSVTQNTSPLKTGPHKKEVAWRCFIKFCQIHKETPVPEPFLIKFQGGVFSIEKNTPTQVFPVNFE